MSGPSRSAEAGHQDVADRPSGGDHVLVPRAELDAILDRLDVLEGRNRPDEAQPAVAPVVAGTGSVLGRRRLLAAMVATAAGTSVAAVGAARPAAAANGSSLVLGNTANTATAATGLSVTGNGAAYGLGVTDNGLSSAPFRAGVLGHARGQNFDAGVLGVSESSIASAVVARAGAGTALTARSDSGVGVRATSVSQSAFIGTTASGASPALVAEGGPYAVWASSENGVQLHLKPRGVPVTDPSIQPSPGSLFASGGRLSGTSRVSATLWACVFSEGADTRWRILAGPASAGSFHVLPVPVRIYDSRPGTQPSVGTKAPLKPGEIRTLDLKVNGSSVPAGATAACLTVMLVNAANVAGNFTVWAGGAAKPAANTMVWGGSAGRFCTTALSTLDAEARIRVSASASTNLVIDVVGYYR